MSTSAAHLRDVTISRMSAEPERLGTRQQEARARRDEKGKEWHGPAILVVVVVRACGRVCTEAQAQEARAAGDQGWSQMKATATTASRQPVKQDSRSQVYEAAN